YDRMRILLDETRISPGKIFALRPFASSPDNAFGLHFVTGFRHEGSKLAHGNVELADREGPGDPHLMLRELGIKTIAVVLQRSHGKTARWRPHHLRTVLTVPEALGALAASAEACAKTCNGQDYKNKPRHRGVSHRQASSMSLVPT